MPQEKNSVLKRKELDSNNTLLVLTAAALTLPGLLPHHSQAQSMQQTAPSVSQEKSVSYRYSQYSEEDIDANVGLGDAQRYDISIHQLRFKSAIADNAEVTLDLVQESMSGASPWYILAGPNEPIVVMSSATIEEQRTDVQANFTTHFTSISSSTALGYATENDYSSFRMSYSLSKALKDNNINLDFGVSGAQDFIEPVSTDAYPTSIDRERKTSGSVNFGFSSLIDRTSVISSAISISFYDGYLSDPYKRVQVRNLPDEFTQGATATCPNGLCADSRPNQRTQWAWTTRYRKSIKRTNSALHMDYRYFADDWEVQSHTVEFAWYQNLANSWQLVPELRWYTQTEAAFYQIYFDNPRNDGYYSNDYRLSPFEALSVKLKLSKFFEFGGLHLSYESYISEELEGQTELASGSPTLVDFSHLTFGIDYKF